MDPETAIAAIVSFLLGAAGSFLGTYLGTIAAMRRLERDNRHES
ncbi:hypothetical protein AAK967_00110 [Atopobiaceae bacterium 24-176]